MSESRRTGFERLALESIAPPQIFTANGDIYNHIGLDCHKHSNRSTIVVDTDLQPESIGATMHPRETLGGPAKSWGERRGRANLTTPSSRSSRRGTQHPGEPAYLVGGYRRIGGNSRQIIAFFDFAGLSLWLEANAPTTGDDALNCAFQSFAWEDRAKKFILPWNFAQSKLARRWFVRLARQGRPTHDPDRPVAAYRLFRQRRSTGATAGRQ